MSIVVGILATIALIVAVAVILDQLIVNGPDIRELRRQNGLIDREKAELTRVNARIARR